MRLRGRIVCRRGRGQSGRGRFRFQPLKPLVDSLGQCVVGLKGEGPVAATKGSEPRDVHSRLVRVVTDRLGQSLKQRVGVLFREAQLVCKQRRKRRRHDADGLLVRGGRVGRGESDGIPGRRARPVLRGVTGMVFDGERAERRQVYGCALLKLIANETGDGIDKFFGGWITHERRGGENRVLSPTGSRDGRSPANPESARNLGRRAWIPKPLFWRLGAQVFGSKHEVNR